MQKSCARLIRVIYSRRSIIGTFIENDRKFIISRVCYIKRFCNGLLIPGGRALVTYIEGSYYRGLVLSSVYYNFLPALSFYNNYILIRRRREFLSSECTALKSNIQSKIIKNNLLLSFCKIQMSLSVPSAYSNIRIEYSKIESNIRNSVRNSFGRCSQRVTKEEAIQVDLGFLGQAPQSKQTHSQGTACSLAQRLSIF